LVWLLPFGLALMFAGCFGGEDHGSVPDVVGKAVTEAGCKLGKAGYRWQVDDGPVQAYSKRRCEQSGHAGGSDQPVRSQRPAPGTKLAPGGVVRLTSPCATQTAGRGCA
jgi:beta-lactam-binding protein with PASTA domain